MDIITNKEIITPLFRGWKDTLIWSCLQDYMGVAYTNDLNKPESAGILVADFCFFAGERNREIVSYPLEICDSECIIMVPENEAWGTLIEQEYGESAERISRFATKKDGDVFDRERLRHFVAKLPKGYEIQMIDEGIFGQTQEQEWAFDLCGQFADYTEYRERGLGVAVLKDGVMVSGASSYTIYRGGIEIEIDTRADERGKGLATACGAQLILECLDRGLYPSWDAHTRISLALAEKLGYHFDKEYTAYLVSNEQ